MSLCIAASCTDADGQPRIALCFDRKVSTDTVSSETEFKLDTLPFGFACLLAGTVTTARELISIYKQHLSTLAEFPREDPLELLRVPIRTKKKRLIESYVQARLGLTYQEFLDRQDQIDVGIRTIMFGRIHDMNVEAELILAGYSKNEPRIFKVAWDEVEQHANFACIGSGSPAAEHALHRRKQESRLSVAMTIYNVYEAKRFGELSPTVGRGTVIAVIHPTPETDPHSSKNYYAVSSSGFSALNKAYEMYGPKPAEGFAVPNLDLFVP
jgi:hypothetical protein